MGAFDLQFTRNVPVVPELLWRGWNAALDQLIALVATL